MLESIKEKVLAAAVKADAGGLCMHKTGNFSMIDRGSGQVVISPSGLDRQGLCPADFPVLDLDGAVVEAGARGRPSREYLFHLQAYKARPDILSVVHTHSHYATAFAVKGRRIEPVVYEAEFYGNKTEIIADFPPGDPGIGEALAVPLSRVDVCLLKNHGVVVVGGDIDDTLLKAFYVEDVAKIYFLSLCLDSAP